MSETDIRKYARLMNELGLTGLEVTENDRVVRLERTPGPSPAQTAASGLTAPESIPDGLVTVTSPMVGVFYAAPAEDAESYVKVGDRVKRGQTLCIVEAMKLMNEIVAEIDGVVTEICSQNGQVVDYGSPLFRLREQEGGKR